MIVDMAIPRLDFPREIVGEILQFAVGVSAETDERLARVSKCWRSAAGKIAERQLLERVPRLVSGNVFFGDLPRQSLLASNAPLWVGQEAMIRIARRLPHSVPLGKSASDVVGEGIQRMFAEGDLSGAAYVAGAVPVRMLQQIGVERLFVSVCNLQCAAYHAKNPPDIEKMVAVVEAFIARRGSLTFSYVRKDRSPEIFVEVFNRLCRVYLAQESPNIEKIGGIVRAYLSRGGDLASLNLPRRESPEVFGRVCDQVCEDYFGGSSPNFMGVAAVAADWFDSGGTLDGLPSIRGCMSTMDIGSAAMLAKAIARSSSSGAAPVVRVVRDRLDGARVPDFLVLFELLECGKNREEMIEFIGRKLESSPISMSERLMWRIVFAWRRFRNSC